MTSNTTSFRPLTIFTLRQIGEGSVLDNGSPEHAALPVLGEYHPGQVYPFTKLNLAGAAQAVAAGAAEMLS
jgi:hypothetical protein